MIENLGIHNMKYLDLPAVRSEVRYFQLVNLEEMLNNLTDYLAGIAVNETILKILKTISIKITPINYFRGNLLYSCFVTPYCSQTFDFSLKDKLIFFMYIFVGLAKLLNVRD